MHTKLISEIKLHIKIPVVVCYYCLSNATFSLSSGNRAPIPLEMAKASSVHYLIIYMTLPYSHLFSYQGHSGLVRNGHLIKLILALKFSRELGKSQFLFAGEFIRRET